MTTAKSVLCPGEELEALDVSSLVDVLPREREDGNVEYKRLLVHPDPTRFEHLVTQMKYRMTEGGGEALYEIGVEDNGTPMGITEGDLNASIETISKMAARLNCDATVLRVRNGDVGKVAEVLVRQKNDEPGFLEVRLATMGNVDAGKSTLLGVLTRGVLDNGRGLARSAVFRHAHELETGRTSSISHEILGFDSKGAIVNYNGVRNPSWTEICAQSAKVLTFLDLAGHERYFKTTVFGLTGMAPDFAMLLVGANQGVIGMAKDHLGIAIALRVPVFVVVTKIDMCPPNIYEQTMAQLNKILKAPGARKIPMVVRCHDDVVVAAKNFDNGRVAPIFPVSSVTGENLDMLRLFLNLLPVKRDWENKIADPVEFHLDDNFSVPGVGTVASGICVAGSIRAGQSDLFLGPDEFGNFIPCPIKTIHTNRLSVNAICAGKSASFALKKVKRNQLRKGMVLVSSELCYCSMRFEAEILILQHSTTIAPGYQAMIHTGCVRQNARILSISQESGFLRAGDKATVTFEFLYRPEFVKNGWRFVFREGRTKGIGKITNAIHHVPRLAGGAAGVKDPKAEKAAAAAAAENNSKVEVASK